MEEGEIKELLSKVLKRIDVSKRRRKRIFEVANWALRKLHKGFSEVKGVEVTLGGSIAKDTFLKTTQDIDIFVRFPKQMKDFMGIFKEKCEDVFPRARLVRGSRDYFRVRKGSYVIEIIPTLQIEKPEEAENTMDLSIFHIAYVKNIFSKRPWLKDEVKLFKAFLQAINCYGAETYKHGFSGYASELLVINFGSFLNTLKQLSQLKPKIFVDPGKHYRNFEEAEACLSEAKLKSPIILIDPTFKERNALASLNYETFSRFVFEARKFLLKPSSNFFKKKKITKSLLLRRSRERGTKLYTLKLKKPLDNEEIFFAKLEKELRKFKARVEREGFKVYEIGFHEVDDEVLIFLELETLLLSKKKIHLGPPVWVDEKFFRDFMEKWKGRVYVYKNRLAVDRKRTDFPSLWKDFTKKVRDLLKTT